MSIFSQKPVICLFHLWSWTTEAPNWGGFGELGKKSFVIFFCWCEIHIFGIAVISVLPLFGRIFWIFASMVLTRPFLLGASDCIWKKNMAKCVWTVLVVLSVFGSVFGPETQCQSTEAMLMTENQAMRIPGTLSTSPGRWLGHHVGREKPHPPVLTASHGVHLWERWHRKQDQCLFIQVYFACCTI